ncbi:endonuclease domain-containing 1 protein-like [Paramisgurnus dabryanus]|uniref:endonuclease domain-containing 1 protein-like n=1 Tax=Paramisgurnus dabryanus TaxID=90735 RepID=UPI0031F4601D
MQLFVGSVICVLLSLSFPGIVSKLENNITQCGDFFFQGKAPVFPDILNDSITQNDSYEIICQTYKNKSRFATLYNTTNKIPVFSAYKYTGTYQTTNRLGQMGQLWMTESQLEPSGAEMSEPFVKQARNQDYWIKKNVYTCTPGALFPISHAADNETAESTLTLTNSVPLKDDFREGLWSLVENTTKEDMDINCRDNNNNIVAYVLTGAIAGNNKMNNRVNIPTLVWTAFCCFNKETLYSRGFWAENKPEKKTEIKLKSLKVVQEYLKKKFGKPVELFSNNCSVNASQLKPILNESQCHNKCHPLLQYVTEFIHYILNDIILQGISNMLVSTE